MATKEEELKTKQESENDDIEYYGWDFHKIPLLGALILTILFYIVLHIIINWKY